MFIPFSRNSFHFLDQLVRFLAYDVSISLLCCISWRRLSHNVLPLSIRLTVRLYLPISQKLSLVACTSSSFSDISTTLWVPAHQQKEETQLQKGNQNSYIHWFTEETFSDFYLKTPEPTSCHTLLVNHVHF